MKNLLHLIFCIIIFSSCNKKNTTPNAPTNDTTIVSNDTSIVSYNLIDSIYTYQGYYIDSNGQYHQVVTTNTYPKSGTIILMKYKDSIERINVFENIFIPYNGGGYYCVGLKGAADVGFLNFRGDTLVFDALTQRQTSSVTATLRAIKN